MLKIFKVSNQLSKMYNIKLEICFTVIVKSLKIAYLMRESGMILSRADFSNIVKNELSRVL